MAIELRGHLYNNAGAALQNADVALFATSVNAINSTSDSSAEATTTTSSAGLWTFSEATQGKYDVRITSGTNIRWRRYNESVQMEEIEVAMLAMRNPGDTFKYDITPGAISADQVLNLPVTTQTTTVVSTPVEDNVLLSLGAGGDAVMLNRSTALSADTELSNVIVGTSDHPGVAANSLIISNITTDGDIMFAVSDGGNSKGLLLIDGSEGLIVPHGSIVPSATNTIDLGTSSLEFKDAFFDGTVTSDAFAGPLTGNVTGNASGTAATVTGGTQASITTVANVVEVGALDAGSITSGFGTIDTGSSSITTTGAADLGATTVDSLTSTGDFTTTGQATDWDLIDNTASALSFDASGKAGILEIVTTNNSEAVKMSGDLDVDGTANLDAVDIDGAVQIDEAVTVGVDDTGREVVFHGDTASSELRWDTDADALVLDCGAVDAGHMVFRSTGSVSHGITSGFPGSGSVGNTDYLDIRKANATIGGAKFSAIAENAALTTVMRFQSIGGTPNATKTTSGSGLVQFDVMENDGSNGVEAITVSGGNVFGISAQGLGCRFLVDEDGDLYSVTSAQTFDEYDDLALVDSYDSIRNDYSEFATEHEDQLIKLGVLGDRVSAGGMTNTSQLQRLHNGAIRQLAGLLEDAMTRLDSAENKLLALEAR